MRPEMQDFGGLRVAITGGTSGLGLALVHELLDRGAQVAFVARTRPAVEQVVAHRPAAHGIVGDVAAIDQIHPIALQILGALGGLDVLVNNASTLGPVPLALLADTECEAFERALDTNVLGPFRLTKASSVPLPWPRERAAAPLCSTFRAMQGSTPIRGGARTAQARQRCTTSVASGTRNWPPRGSASSRWTPAIWTHRCTERHFLMRIGRS